jgi:hypothetical protein
MLNRCRAALSDVHDPDSERAATAAYLIAVYGRAVTQVIEKVKKYDRKHSNEWWEPHQELVSTDPLLKFFNHLRNQFPKEGGVNLSGGTLVGVGDPGGPPGQRWLWRLTPSPTVHKGQAIPPAPRMGMIEVREPDVGTLGRLYIEWLESVLDEASSEFSRTPFRG